jgi:hypothetical protein
MNRLLGMCGAIESFSELEDSTYQSQCEQDIYYEELEDFLHPPAGKALLLKQHEEVRDRYLQHKKGCSACKFISNGRCAEAEKLFIESVRLFQEYEKATK